MYAYKTGAHAFPTSLFHYSFSKGMAAATPHNPLHQMALIPPSPNNTKSHRPSLISINHSTSKNPIRALTTSKNNNTRVRVRVRVAVICCCASHSQTQTVNNHNDNNNSNSNSSNNNNIIKYGRILLSDVAVKRKRRVYWGRKWTSLDVATAGVVVAMHGLCVLAPLNFNWSAFWVAVVLYVVTGLFGITLSFHRNLAHRSFKLPKWVEYLFAYFGVQAMQGNPMDWVSTHRYHHQFCDSERDPHSPIEGFWFSHMSWLFDSSSVVQRCGGPSNVGDLEKQPFYRFLKRTYIIHPVALGVLLYGLGGFPFLVWGMGVRIVWVYHITWLVNSACHVWGRQSWNTRDLSRNNWWVALLAFGEGWHNNHHAFEFSARHGLEWYEFDMTWYVVRLLQAVGLATDVKVPSEAQKQKMSTPTLT